MQVGKIEFGEIDAKNEVFKQRRAGKSVFRTSFQEPPGIDIQAMLKGESFFVTGQKGCGKTALLLYLQEEASSKGWSTETILFRSGISEQERQHILAGTQFSVIDFREKNKVEYDFLFNWLWVIYASILRRIEPDWVFEGKDILSDLKNILRVTNETNIKAFSDLSVKKISARANLAFKIPFLTAELGADIEAVKDTPKDRVPLEIIKIVERYINEIKILPKYRVLLFFDELELFWSKKDQRTRDLALIRDLLQAVSRTNLNLDALGSSVVVYASVRSEVLDEVNQLSPEIARDVEDFGVDVNWNVTASADNQPILQIVEAKIRSSEIEELGLQTDQVWESYFPEQVYGKDAEAYLLDVSMFKPRFIIMRLNLAKSYCPDSEFFSAESFEETSTKFSNLAWREVSEQLLHIFSQQRVDNLRAILSAWKATFSLEDVEHRAQNLNLKKPGVIDGFRNRTEINEIFSVLYESGAVGNRFFISDGKKSVARDRWAFRGHSEAVFDKPFTIHESLRKHFQLMYD